MLWLKQLESWNNVHWSLKILALVTVIFASIALSGCFGGAADEGGGGGGGGGGDGATSYWDWQLTEPFDLTRDVQVFDLDPDSVTPAQIAALNSQGIKTVCYVSIGTLEDYRDDVASFPASVIGNTYGDWPDERFLDVREIDILKPLMAARFQNCLDMGFNAIEPDNMDVHENDSGFDISSADMVAYILALADVAHGMGLEYAQKNVPELTPLLVGSADFIIAESCFQDNWCGDILAYSAAGKDILDAEYSDRPVDFDVACGYAANNNIRMILKDRDLTAELQTCQ